MKSRQGRQKDGVQNDGLKSLQKLPKNITREHTVGDLGLFCKYPVPLSSDKRSMYVCIQNGVICLRRPTGDPMA